MSMGFEKKAWHLVLLVLFMANLLISCGGGGDDLPLALPINPGPTSVGMSAADFSGDYRAGNVGFDPDMFADVTELGSDGAGTVTYRVVGSTDSGTVSYAVAEDGLFVADNSETGQLSTDGNMFHLIDADASDGDLILSFGLKKSSGVGPAILSGSYMVFIVSPIANRNFETWRLSIEFDGAGNFVVSTLTTPPVSSPPVPYTVADDGGLTITTGLDGQGQVSPDGNTFFVAGSAGLVIGVRQSTTKTLADFSGAYHLVGLADDDVDSDGVNANRSIATLDGAGNVDISVVEDSSGMMAPPYSETIDVMTDEGMFESGDVVGQISGSNGLIILADELVGNMDVRSQFMIGIIKP